MAGMDVCRVGLSESLVSRGVVGRAKPERVLGCVVRVACVGLFATLGCSTKATDEKDPVGGTGETDGAGTAGATSTTGTPPPGASAGTTGGATTGGATTGGITTGSPPPPSATGPATTGATTTGATTTAGGTFGTTGATGTGGSGDTSSGTGNDPSSPPWGEGSVCPEVFLCLTGCTDATGPSDPCIVACLEQGTLSSSQEAQELANCALAEACTDEACLKAKCATAWTECFTGALSCGEVLECADRCDRGDEACQMRCVVRGTPAAQEAVREVIECFERSTDPTACGPALERCR